MAQATNGEVYRFPVRGTYDHARKKDEVLGATAVSYIYEKAAEL